MQGLSDLSHESQQMRNRIQPYQLSRDWIDSEEYDMKFFQEQQPSTNQKNKNFDQMCQPQNIDNFNETSQQHLSQKQETPLDQAIDQYSQSSFKYKISIYKTVLRQFYKNVKEKISENEVNNEWKQIMTKQLKGYKKKGFKYNITSMDHLFCKGSGLPEEIIKQNRKLLIQLLNSQKFKGKIKKSKYFKQNKRVKYLFEAKLILLKIQRKVKSFAERLKEKN